MMKRLNSPICDFTDKYADSGSIRFHMPGHKGASFVGCERQDITEIHGADSLYCPEGIIRESENAAASLFGAAKALYSTEGSSQCIRAMLYLAVLNFKSCRNRTEEQLRPAFIAPRNVHKAFLTAVAVLDADVVWLWPENEDYSLCRCDVSPGQIEDAIRGKNNVAGVYITSPDYLGGCADIEAMAAAAHKYGVPVLVDDAHGAYRKFIKPSRHPMDAGADVCCDSAHKTLPALTGGAYLFVSESAPSIFCEKAKTAMAMFGSTSPSYLILRSLDRTNAYVSGDYPASLKQRADEVSSLKERLSSAGWSFYGDEPMKITIETKKYGYKGYEVSEELARRNIVCEHADEDYLVIMVSPENTEKELSALESALRSIERRKPLMESSPRLIPPEYAASIREALFSPTQSVSLEEAEGRVAASLTTSCPPAVSPIAPGERINRSVVEILKYYGIKKIDVLS